MKTISSIIVLFVILFFTNCKKSDFANKTSDVQVVAFHAEKLYCYWGWDIKIGSQIIKADSIPTLKPWADTIFPINCKITIGSKTRTCGEKGVDYYQIEEFVRTK
jgi:hypothetical protein